MALQFNCDDEGAYVAKNDAADFEIMRGPAGWNLTAVRHKGGMLFATLPTLADAKATANRKSCEAGWHKV